jgi:uncharacterized protein
MRRLNSLDRFKAGRLNNRNINRNCLQIIQSTSERIKMKIKNKIIGLALIVIIIFLPFIMTGCFGTGIPEITMPDETADQTFKNTISVDGNGTIKVLPDEVVVDISIITEKPTTEEAVNENNSIFDKVKRSIEKINAANLKIETTNFDLSPLYDYSVQNKPPKIYAYQVTSTIEVRTTDLNKMGEIIANAIESGATNISSIGFDLTESSKQKAVNDALTAAANDARFKAKTLADSMGLTINKVYSINESGTNFSGSLRTSMKAAPEGKGADVSAPEILPQEIEISASVSVVYLFTSE